MAQGGLHRNSQRRFYDQDHIYFITTVTEQRFPYFQEELFCELFLENLKMGKKLKEFLLYGFIIIPDHVHLLLKPNGEYNISGIMHAIKRHFSRNVNLIINEGEVGQPRLQSRGDEYKKFADIINNNDEKIQRYKNLFIKKYGQTQFEMPGFRWQQSFHDHVIRNEKDFYKHLNYIALNCVKHNICQNEENYKWSFLNKRFKFLIDDFWNLKIKHRRRDSPISPSKFNP